MKGYTDAWMQKTSLGCQRQVGGGYAMLCIYMPIRHTGAVDSGLRQGVWILDFLRFLESFNLAEFLYSGSWESLDCRDIFWALEYHTLILFFLKEPFWNKSLYFFLPGYLKAQYCWGCIAAWFTGRSYIAFALADTHYTMGFWAGAGFT